MRNEIGKVNKLIEKRRIGKGFVIRWLSLVEVSVDYDVDDRWKRKLLF
jgi:hypothetical protein